MKLSDYVMEFFAGKGVGDVFMVSGGGIMHLVESLGSNPSLKYWCNYHEQACVIAAETCAKARGRPSVCLVTAGPGAGNAISGLAGAWVDSAPVICLAGQVRSDILADYSKIRQRGPQEGNNLALAAPITKYAVRVASPSEIRHALERAWHEASTGQPGPVYVEIPLDVQGAQIDPDALEGFAPADPSARWDFRIDEVLEALRAAKRPLFVFGNGVRWAGAADRLPRLLEKAPFPVAMPFSAKDLMPEDHPCNMGIFGTSGQRRANFAVQNCDCLVAVGAGLSITKVGFNYDKFAPLAKKILVDVDEGQLYHQAVKPDLAILADAGAFLDALLAALGPDGAVLKPSDRWRDACRRWKERYPILEAPEDPEGINNYRFTDRLAELMTAQDALVTGNGLDCVSYWQAFRVKPGQRTMLNGNWGSMGWDLPAAVGLCVGRGVRRTVCLTGDGSIQWNVQELLTIGHNRLPVKIFVFNNEGYSAIRATQDNFFAGHYVGADAASGVGNPDFKLLAGAYGLAYSRIDSPGEVDAGIEKALAAEGPTLCEVRISRTLWISPKASAFKRPDGTLESRPLEDMAPFLPREEVWENMHQFDDETES